MLARLVLVLAAAVLAKAYTLPSELAKLQVLKGQLQARGPVWNTQLNELNDQYWQNLDQTTSNETCDPCGASQLWGNWRYMACRGFTIKRQDILGGNGYVTNIHFTDFQGEGPTLPIPDLCVFPHLKECDIAGHGANPTIPMGGTIPDELGYCFPELNSFKFSFNQLTGTIPEFIGNLSQLREMKIRANHFHGTIPENLGELTNLYFLDYSNNSLTGTIPTTFANNKNLAEVLLAHNDIEGDLYNFAGTELLQSELSGNTKLCGMVPQGVRFSHGFNPYNTGLGKPCPGALYPPEL